MEKEYRDKIGINTADNLNVLKTRQSDVPEPQISCSISNLVPLADESQIERNAHPGLHN
ncbi:unnamed protein product [Schistosoma margrebowiei]|uniref:Uncharacterized protein n=1 Tax=Schistosoma margrebowiei TaxID=48269 RepID=A0A183MC87_9TREM|nr:unnamed protein product [Schistosoma margrebowiei]